MAATIDYYFAPVSPWTYLGHARFAEIAARTGAQVNVQPIDLGKVFPVSGGLPLGQRSAQRQAYRLLEMKRFSEHLKLPMNLHPQHFPTPGEAAARLILCAAALDGQVAALQLCGATFAAVWAQERNIADADVLAQLLAECGLAAERLAQSQQAQWLSEYQACTQRAIEANVFGAPSFVIDGEMFWGQDRLEFVDIKCRQLAD
ncbi:MAG: 2-hydroxychromene-2-carboxylate isomerase [Burkholderiaceae bacterium]